VQWTGSGFSFFSRRETGITPGIAAAAGVPEHFVKIDIFNDRIL
jgi:hypothetical protein